MEKITRMFLKVRESQPGQTMAEYGLILAAVAVLVYASYLTMGGNITSLLGTIDGYL